jgi:LytS/YehU family sensor histidine kinase
MRNITRRLIALYGRSLEINGELGSRTTVELVISYQEKKVIFSWLF